MKENIKILVFIGFIGSSFIGFTQSTEDQIRSIMDQQVEQWNEGDIAGFMKGYWESEQLIFIGSKGLTYGWQQTLDNYKKGYPDREAMGALSFDYKAFIPLGQQHMLVIGSWSIQKANDEVLQGHFSLTWEKQKQGWVIIADHSS